jgi:hypothetical protein
MESLASILLIALALALLLAYTRGGLQGVGEWLHVKFVGAQ